MSECNEKVKSVFYTPSEREIYIREHIAEKDHYSIMQEKFESGKMEGMEEGREETTIKIAKVMLEDGMDKVLIQKYTGLDWEQLENLLEE
ncbi:MAG TPA: hypothetical protein GX734_04175 [Clostridiaceae bacterium]|nr:hypothetical protein [Clostridiaceae bacterium]